jgi:DNA repair photolyase
MASEPSPLGGEPPLEITFEPRFCANHVADLTVGCSFRCVYCPFSDLAARRARLARPTRVDMAGLAAAPAPASLFLSPASDPFSPQAAAQTHALLSHVLPRGTMVALLTKGVIPERTVELLARYRDRVEGVGVGVTSLDDHRNAILEPGCPPASARLGNLDRLAACELPTTLRLDPLFPELDDAPAALAGLVGEAARRGAYAITATYVFAWGRYLRRLRREPRLAPACALLTERAPMEGGTAFSVPLDRKLETYALLAELAARHGLWFNTCGCKDLRVRESGRFFASCRNAFRLTEPRGLPTPREGSRAPAAGAPAAPPAPLPA